MPSEKVSASSQYFPRQLVHARNQTGKWMSLRWPERESWTFNRVKSVQPNYEEYNNRNYGGKKPPHESWTRQIVPFLKGRDYPLNSLQQAVAQDERCSRLASSGGHDQAAAA
jgi:hypothetical protein